MRVLVVEDEEVIAEDLLRSLRANGFAAELAANGPCAWERGGTEPFDAAVLDLALPGMDGLSILRRWRAEGVTYPILVLSARSDWATRVEAIDAGADDYLVKPFAMEELLARIRAILRRSGGISTNVMNLGELMVDPRSRRVTLSGAQLELTPLEFRLLTYLMHNRGRCVSQSELAEHLYADERERRENAIEAAVARLRRKIGGHRISTRRGFGYEIEDPE